MQQKQSAMRKKEIITITIEEKSYRKQKTCHICRKEFSTNRGAAHACNLRYKKPIEIIAVFHNGSKYDSHFIIKELAEEFKGQIECLEKKTEKYITFSLPLNEEIGNNKAIT